MQLTVYIEQDENGRFIGSIPSIPSCYAEGETQEEMMKNLKEVLTLCMRNQEDFAPSTHFVGIQTFFHSDAKTRSHSSQTSHQNFEKIGV